MLYCVVFIKCKKTVLETVGKIKHKQGIRWCKEIIVNYVGYDNVIFCVRFKKKILSVKGIKYLWVKWYDDGYLL